MKADSNNTPLDLLVSSLFKLTGGRPMVDIGGAFTDVVSGKSVRYYRDKFGRKWMADSGKWSFFRVAC